MKRLQTEMPAFRDCVIVAPVPSRDKVFVCEGCGESREFTNLIRSSHNAKLISARCINCRA